LLRKAIWEHYSEDLSLQETEIDASKEDAKKIWDKLSNYMPVYSLFQSDRKNSDGDSEVQDPLKEAVKEILNDASLRDDLNNIAEKVNHKLQDVASRTLKKLKEIDSEIARNLNPVIPAVNATNLPIL
jgi:cysteinyl-tRNA synthetase